VKQNKAKFAVIAVLFLILSLIGFIDATYLTAKHYLGSPVTCSLTSGCEIVTTSEYSTIFGVPVALGGAVYYFIILLLSIIYTETKRDRLLKFIALFTIIGFLSSAWFVYLQIFVLHALCLYCLASAATSTALFITGIVLLGKIKNPPDAANFDE